MGKYIKHNEEETPEQDFCLIPCNTGVILQFYDENPYTISQKTIGGIIIGHGGHRKQHSNSTGELEEDVQMVACAKVIAVGPKCENVQIGEDVFCYKGIAQPIPFLQQGYHNISEQNIMCRVILQEQKKEDEPAEPGCGCPE